MFKKNFSDDIQRLKSKETPFKSLGSAITTINNTSSASSASNTRPNMNSTHSNPSLASITTNRRGSSLFRDLDRPILMKSRTNSITHGTTSSTNGHSPHLVSPKSPSYFAIPTVYEEHSSSKLKLQHTESSSSLESSSSVPSGYIHPNEITHTTTKSDNGLSKSLKLTIRRKTTRKSSNASSG